jgi:hypothetical protein
LTKSIRRDFKLLADGVEFEVHAVFLLGGSVVLDEYISGGSVSTLIHGEITILNNSQGDQTPIHSTYIFDLRYFSPIMIDRYVNFVYTGSFRMNKEGEDKDSHHTTKLPPGKTKVDFGLQIETPIHFYLTIYGMGERPRDATLMDIAHAKMAEDSCSKALSNQSYFR